MTHKKSSAAARRSAAARFDRTSMIFHWATLLLIVAAFSSIEMRVLFERGTPIRDATKEWHYLIGLALFLTTVGRLVHRLGRGKSPPVIPARPGWEVFLGLAMHWLLYAVLLALPVLGIITVIFLGDRIPLAFGIEFPAVVAMNEPRGEWLEGVHSFVGDTLYVLIFLHAAAALLHHYVLRDTTLVRMLPARKAATRRKTAPSLARRTRKV